MFIDRLLSPLGEILLCSTGDKLSGLLFSGENNESSILSRDSEHIPDPHLEIFLETRKWLDLYFAGHDPGFIPPLEITGNDFFRTVQHILLTIPYGSSATYGEIARKTAQEMHVSHMSSQAIGGALGRNMISIIIPCHRVLGATGKLTGYSGGFSRKKYLLDLEGIKYRTD